MIRIKNFILNSSYFELDDEDEESLRFATRKNGVVGVDCDYPGVEDIKEAERICELVNSKFPTVIAEDDISDEWTYIHVYLK